VPPSASRASNRPGTHDATLGEQERQVRHREQRAVTRDLGIDHGALARSYSCHVHRHCLGPYTVLRTMLHEARDLRTADHVLAR